MNKQSQAVLIIVSILILATKDSMSLVHTLLHCIPDNPWHQHNEIHIHKQSVNLLDIHKYLQHKHFHAHHEHTHVHDVMDHIHTDEDGNESASYPKKINLTLKIDYYFQSQYGFHFHQYSISVLLNHFSTCLTSIRNAYTSPSFEPPQTELT